MPLHLSPDVKLVTRCPLCQSADIVPGHGERNLVNEGAPSELRAFDNSWIHLARCRACGFGFTQELPSSPSFFSNRYDNPHFDPAQESQGSRKREILEDIFSKLERLGVARGARLLDVGAFAGQLLRVARERGYDASGVEPNPKLAAYARDVLGFKVYPGQLQELALPDRHFDVVTLVDVLEHLVDPRGVLEKLRGALAPGGFMVVKVPNFPMQRSKQLVANRLGISRAGVFAGFGHINHFSGRSLVGIFETLGFEVAGLQVARSELWPVPAGDWRTTARHRLKNAARDGYLLAARTLHRATGVNAGFNLVCYARRPAG